MFFLTTGLEGGGGTRLDLARSLSVLEDACSLRRATVRRWNVRVQRFLFLLTCDDGGGAVADFVFFLLANETLFPRKTALL